MNFNMHQSADKTEYLTNFTLRVIEILCNNENVVRIS